MKFKWIFWIVLVAMLLVACRGISAVETPVADSPTAVPATVTIEPEEDVLPPPELSEPPPAGATREFMTDFSKHNISYSEIISGGPPKDGIPSIDDPVFISVDDAEG